MTTADTDDVVDDDAATAGEAVRDDSASRRRMFRVAGLAAVGAVAAACKPAAGSAPGTTAPKPPVTAKPSPPTTMKPAPPVTVKPPKPTTTLPPTTTPPSTVPPAPVPPGWPDAGALHAARRLSWGATPQLAHEIHTHGLEAWLDAQLAWQQLDDSHVAPMLTPYPRPTWSAAQVRDNESWRLPQELAAHDTLRRIFSRRQLHEVLSDFWHDHFNVDVNHSLAGLHMGTYDRDVIRPHALGRFCDILPAVAAAPAMLHYLDQANSRADGGRTPNENYARELMELHTVGSGGGYSEADVVAVAHLLTGWSVAGSNYSERKVGGFSFRSAWHHPGPFAAGHQVLGWGTGGLTCEAAGRAFLDHLARHPTTARRVCHKLAVRLIGEHITPTSAVVDAAVAAWNAHGTAIGPVVKALVLSPEFAASAGAKVRRPSDQLTQFARALGVQWNPEHANSFLWLNWNTLTQAGNAPHTWPPPNGFPDRNRAWLSVSSMVWRWNLAVWFAYGSTSGIGFDSRSTQAWAPNGRWGEWLDELARRLVGVPWPPAVRAAVLAQHGVTETTTFRSWDHWAASPVVAVLLQTAAFQRR